MVSAMLTASFSHGQLVTSGLDDGSDGTLRQEITDTPAGGTITFYDVFRRCPTNERGVPVNPFRAMEDKVRTL